MIIPEKVTVWPLVASAVGAGSTVAAYGPMRGGFIINPTSAADQNVPIAEPLYIDLLNPAALRQTSTTSILNPGDPPFVFPAGFVGTVYVNAVTPGHRFSGAVYQPSKGFTVSTASFPPAGLTSLLSVLPQYLYEQYADDQSLIAFVQAFNEIVQSYVDYLNTVNLPVYTGLQGKLLDWVALGMYGFERPLLPIGVGQTLGPYNTAPYNTIAYDAYDHIAPTEYFATTDDVFRRILTWYLYLGDGKQFNIRWIKRRVERFLAGMDGSGGPSAAGSPSNAQMYPPDSTYDVGVTFGVDGQININLQTVIRTATGGALYNFAPYNGFAYNDLDSEAMSLPVSPLVPIFKAAVDSGVLAFPFQLAPIVNVG